MTERWLPIPGFGGIYEVSDLGRVRSVARTITLSTKTRSGGVRQIDRHLSARIIGQNVSARGYLRVRLADDLQLVHAIVLSTFVGPRPEGHVSRHLDGNKTRNHLVNLAWGTQKENCEDTAEHGTRPLGTRRPNAKLTERCIPAIRSACKLFPTATVASAFGVSRGSVLQIRAGRTWAHVTQATDEDAESVKTVGDLYRLAERLAGESVGVAA